MNTIETIAKAKTLFKNSLTEAPRITEWDLENFVIQSDEPAVVKCLALNAVINYVALNAETADEEIMHDDYWTLEGWEEMQTEEPELFKEYVEKLDNKVMEYDSIEW